MHGLDALSFCLAVELILLAQLLLHLGNVDAACMGNGGK